MQHIYYYTLVFFLLCLGGSASGQNMSVSSFRLLENDLTANAHGTQRQDQNGQTCALIKVVTPMTGFVFDGGSMGIVEQQQHAGEMWLYLPRHAQKLTISHQSLGTLRDYYYPMAVEGGRTYELLLDIGTGLFTNIVAQMDKADIFIDGEYAGKSPIYNRYMNYGQHTLRAVKGMWEGTQQNIVTIGSKETVINVAMQDQSAHYGDVVLTVTGGADIYVDGKLVGNSSWNTQLKEGLYTVVTKKADCEDATTNFTVKAGQKNEITAAAPRPYVGYLQLYTRPRAVIATLDGRSQVDLTQQLTLPIGTHQLSVARKGYVTQDKEYRIENQRIIYDTLQLHRISYFKEFNFYFGAGYTLRKMAGITATAGFTYKHHDVQAGYTFGLNASDSVTWYQNGLQVSRQTYKMSSASISYGYQIELTRQLSITPQVGYQFSSINSASQVGSMSIGDGSTAHSATLGAKILYVPLSRVCLFAQPHYSLAMSKDNNFETVADLAGLPLNHFAATFGVMVMF